MDIAANGLANGLVSLALPGIDRGRQSRAQTEQREQTRQQTGNQNPARNGRGIRGDAPRQTSVNANRATSSTQNFLSERESAQTATRQFSVPAAIQTFRDNEALIAPEGQQRQVSGIIDEFV